MDAAGFVQLVASAYPELGAELDDPGAAKGLAWHQRVHGNPSGWWVDVEGTVQHTRGLGRWGLCGFLALAYRGRQPLAGKLASVSCCPSWMSATDARSIRYEGS